MHELTLARALIAAAERALTAHDGRRVTGLSVSIGAMSGCEPDLLSHLFPHAAVGTRFEGARLEVEFQPVQVVCRDCGQTSEVEPGRLLCPCCDSLAVTLIAGEGVFLTGLRVSGEADELGI